MFDKNAPEQFKIISETQTELCLAPVDDNGIVLEESLIVGKNNLSKIRDLNLLAKTTWSNAKANLDAAKILLSESKNNSILLFPTTVLGAFSCELFLKCLLLDNDKKLDSHKLLYLYNLLNEEFKIDILSLVRNATEEEFKENLKLYSNIFVDARYINEKTTTIFNPDFVICFAEILESISWKKIIVV